MHTRRPGYTLDAQGDADAYRARGCPGQSEVRPSSGISSVLWAAGPACHVAHSPDLFSDFPDGISLTGGAAATSLRKGPARVCPRGRGSAVPGTASAMFLISIPIYESERPDVVVAVDDHAVASRIVGEGGAVAAWHYG